MASSLYRGPSRRCVTLRCRSTVLSPSTNCMDTIQHETDPTIPFLQPLHTFVCFPFFPPLTPLSPIKQKSSHCSVTEPHVWWHSDVISHERGGWLFSWTSYMDAVGKQIIPMSTALAEYFGTQKGKQETQRQCRSSGSGEEISWPIRFSR